MSEKIVSEKEINEDSKFDCTQKATYYCWHGCAKRKKKNTCYLGPSRTGKPVKDLSVTKKSWKR